MELTAEVKACITKSVFCWLATASKENIPNVSPKEIFKFYGFDKIIVANIASPQTVRNIKQNANQIKGKAEIIKKTDYRFAEMENVLIKMTEGKFPMVSITQITAEQVKPIIAPKYIYFPNTTEQEQIESAKKLYGF